MNLNRKVTTLIAVNLLLLIQACAATVQQSTIIWDLSAHSNQINQVGWPSDLNNTIYWIGGQNTVTVNLPGGHQLNEIETKGIYIDRKNKTTDIIGSVKLQTIDLTRNEANEQIEHFLNSFGLSEDPDVRRRLNDWNAHWLEFEKDPEANKSSYDFGGDSDFGARVFIDGENEGPMAIIGTWGTSSAEKPWRLTYTISYPAGWDLETDR